MDGSGLTHVDEHGAARMVDVTAKDVTVREATARGRVQTTPEVVALLARDGLPKGDALAVARIAGIGAARKRALLAHFGSAKGVARAGLPDLQAVEGISETMARTIHDHFHGQG